MTEKCTRCGVIGHDRRTLWMACLYEMSETGVPFELRGARGTTWEKVVEMKRATWGNIIPVWSDTDQSDDDMAKAMRMVQPFYTLRVCKGCRSEWLEAIQSWFRADPGENGRWNNDAGHEPAPLADLLIEAERLRVDVLSIQQRISDTVDDLRREHDKRTEAVNGV